MSIIQKNIYIGANATGATLTFGLSGGVDISGYQQEIDGITEKKKQELVNPIEDFEIVRFSPNLTKRLRFYFLNVGNTSYANSFTNAGFTSSELSNRDDVVRNSFIIADLYDTYIPNTQTRLATTYQTKIGATPDYSLKTDLNHQLCAINFHKWYLDTLTDSFVVAYMMISVIPKICISRFIYIRYPRHGNSLLTQTPMNSHQIAHMFRETMKHFRISKTKNKHILMEMCLKTMVLMILFE